MYICVWPSIHLAFFNILSIKELTEVIIDNGPSKRFANYIMVIPISKSPVSFISLRNVIFFLKRIIDKP